MDSACGIWSHQNAIQLKWMLRTVGRTSSYSYNFIRTSVIQAFWMANCLYTGMQSSLSWGWHGYSKKCIQFSDQQCTAKWIRYHILLWITLLVRELGGHHTVRIYQDIRTLVIKAFWMANFLSRTRTCLLPFFSRQYSQKFIRMKLNEIYTDRLE